MVCGLISYEKCYCGALYAALMGDTSSMRVTFSIELGDLSGNSLIFKETPAMNHNGVLVPSFVLLFGKKKNDLLYTSV